MLKRATALSVFAGVRGSLVAPHIAALQSHLADNNLGCNDGQKLIQAVTQVIDAGLGSVQKPDVVLLEGIEKALGVLIVSAGRSQGVLQYTVKCLCNVVNQGTENYGLVEELLKRIYQYLQSAAQNPEDQQDLLVRYLILLGFFCRYYDFDHPQNAEVISSIDVRPRRKDPFIVASCLQTQSHYLVHVCRSMKTTRAYLVKLMAQKSRHSTSGTSTVLPSP